MKNKETEVRITLSEEHIDYLHNHGTGVLYNEVTYLHDQNWYEYKSDGIFKVHSEIPKEIYSFGVIKTKSRSAKVEFIKNEKGKWHWKFTAPNGRVVANNHGHNTKDVCRRGFYSLFDYLSQGMFIDEEGERPPLRKPKS